MILFKIKKRKVWHIANRTSSLCHNATTYDPVKSRGLVNEPSAYKEQDEYEIYTSKPDEEYADLLETNEISNDIHGSICKACVMHAFDSGKVRIVGAEK